MCFVLLQCFKCPGSSEGLTGFFVCYHFDIYYLVGLVNLFPLLSLTRLFIFLCFASFFILYFGFLSFVFRRLQVKVPRHNDVMNLEKNYRNENNCLKCRFIDQTIFRRNTSVGVVLNSSIRRGVYSVKHNFFKIAIREVCLEVRQTSRLVFAKNTVFVF